MRKTKHILCVDLCSDFNALTCLVLAEAGYRVTAVVSTREAVTLTEVHLYDAYIFDNDLPDHGALDLCRFIREERENAPIIVYSDERFGVDESKAIEAGATKYLNKHESPRIIAEILESLISKAA